MLICVLKRVPLLANFQLPTTKFSCKFIMFQEFFITLKWTFFKKIQTLFSIIKYAMHSQYWITYSC